MAFTETVRGDPLKFELSLTGRSEVFVMQVSNGFLSGFCVDWNILKFLYKISNCAIYCPNLCAARNLPKHCLPWWFWVIFVNNKVRKVWKSRITFDWNQGELGYCIGESIICGSCDFGSLLFSKTFFSQELCFSPLSKKLPLIRCYLIWFLLFPISSNNPESYYYEKMFLSASLSFENRGCRALVIPFPEAHIHY